MLHDKFDGGVSYSAVWNLLGTAPSLSQADLDYPCASFPVTFASAEKDLKLASYIPINDIDKRCYEQCTLSHFGKVD